MKFQDDLIKGYVPPLYSPDSSIILSLKSEFERVREQYSSNRIYNLIDQANISMESLALEQSFAAKIAEEAASINKYWIKEIESIKPFSSMEKILKLTTTEHIDSIVQTSLLAQKNLLSSDFERLKNSIIHETGDLTRIIESFTNLTADYNTLINSFNTKEFDILDFPPFVSGLPPIEMLTSSELVNKISRDKTEDYVEEDVFINEIREDIEYSLEELLAYIDPKIKILWRGAKEALSSNNPDKKRHVVVSLREMLTHILHGIAPDEELKKWTSDPNHFHDGRPTRRARLLFVCREINNGPFEQFMQMDVKSHLKFIDLFQRGTHEIDIKYTDQHLRALLVRTEALARFLLITWKDTL
ncbi:MAG: hypothetical protein GY834_10025 [Bacteroidetes bacterium]|nr:hypothetical protein [Bacteroidota bacterium]